jgi:hypothetical protein
VLSEVVLGSASNSDEPSERVQKMTARTVSFGNAKFIVAGTASSNPSGSKENTCVSAPVGDEGVAADIVNVMGVSTAPGGTTSDDPPPRLTMPP